MKKILLFLMSAIIIEGCQSAEYTFKMTQPVPNDQLVYENDTLKIGLSISKINVRTIEFSLHNKLQVPLKLIWDDMSISFDGNTSRVMHKGTKFVDRNILQPNTNIPSQGYVNETIAPNDYTRLKCDKAQRCEWVNTAFLPVKYNRNVVAYKGSTISLLLAYQIEGKSFSKNIGVVVDKVGY